MGFKFKHHWKRIPVAIRKPLIFIVGFAVIATGVAMLVLPGPGWAAIFLGFAILATEFAFAVKVRDWLTDELKSAGRNGKALFLTAWRKLKRKRK